MVAIAIIGAGPAGLAAAQEAARRGVKVTVFEKGRVGQGIRCAEGYFDLLGLLEMPTSGVRYKVKGIYFQAIKKHYLSSKKLQIWMLDRSRWQEDLAMEALKWGVEIRENTPVSLGKLSRIQDTYDWVIDASGVPPISASAYGFRDFYLSYSLITAQYTLEGDFSPQKNTFKVGLDPNYFGYYWIFPRDDKTANVGVGLLPDKENRRSLGDIWPLANKVLERENIRAAKPVKKCGGLCPAKIPPRLVWDNTILVGDAAGLCSPLHGGGIDRALLSGRLAVKAIAAGEVSTYRDELWQLLERYLQLEMSLVDIWEKASFEDLERLISGVSALARGKRISSLLPLSRDLLPSAAYFVKFWQALQGEGLSSGLQLQ